MSARPWSKFVIGAIVVFAALARVPGLFTEFWGDEIWSWSIAGQLHSIPDILLGASAQIDNNHPLNTLWLYLCGPHAAAWWYRMPSLAAGIGSVLVAVHIMWRRNRIAAVAAAVLIGFNYPLIFYSSEARGYAPAVFFGFVALDALEVTLARESGAADVVFGLAASLGFLSHLTFLHVYVAAFVWSVVQLKQSAGMRSSWLIRLVRLHALPLMTAMLLYAVFVKNMVIGGAVPTDPVHVILWTLSLAVGGPDGGLGGAIVAAIALAIFILALLLNRNVRREWIFFSIVVLGSPAITTVRELAFSPHPQPLMVRYFLVCLAMLLLGLCPLIVWFWQHSHVMRAAIVLAGICYLIGSSYHLCDFWRNGRGHAGAALADIAAAQPTGPIELATDNVPRTQMLVSFYGPRLTPPRAFDLQSTASPWLVLNRMEASGAASSTFDGSAYQLDKIYPSTALSGWSWLIYRRIR